MSNSDTPDQSSSNQTSEMDTARAKGARMLRYVAIAVAAYMLLMGVLGLIFPPMDSHPIQDQRLSVIAHRGGKALYPENTMLAFESAAALGVDVIHMDVRLTADQVPVLLHDEDILRTTSGEGLISEYNFNDLRFFDAAYWWPYEKKPDCEVCRTRPAEEHLFRNQGIHIPSLEEVFQTLPDVTKLIELQSDEQELVGIIGQLISSYDQAEHVIVAASSAQVLKDFREQFPEVATIATAGELRTYYILNLIGFSSAYAPSAEILRAPVDFDILPVITEGFVQHAHENNTRVISEVIDDREQMEMLLAMGIDGILTNDPSVLLRELGR